MTTPKELDAITDVVLAYKPKPKTKAAKRRKRKKTKGFIYLTPARELATIEP